MLIFPTEFAAEREETPSPALGEKMNRTKVPWYRTPDIQYLVRRTILASLIISVWLVAIAFTQATTQATEASKPLSIRVTHLLGFDTAPTNANGTLSIQGDALQFQKDGKAAEQVKIAAIENIFIDEQDQQVGGVPMTLAKTAAPFGGGRVVSLFAHKKYDTLAFEYVDPKGGIHGAIFQMDKGQADVVKKELVAKGASIHHNEKESGSPAGGGGAR